MTVIIWLKHKWDVYIASDWRTLWWDEILKDNSMKQINHNWTIIAFAWDVRIKNALSFQLKELNKELLIRNESDIYLLYSVLYRYLKDTWFIDIGTILNFSILIWVPWWRLFELDWYWTVMEYDTYKCGGSGWEMADAILSQLVIKNPETEIKYVMKEVFKKHSGTWGKITISIVPWKKTLSKVAKIMK